jgi:light-regulated signal transduction histidine kinase (bacteriophytochrome)
MAEQSAIGRHARDFLTVAAMDMLRARMMELDASKVERIFEVELLRSGGLFDLASIALAVRWCWNLNPARVIRAAITCPWSARCSMRPAHPSRSRPVCETAARQLRALTGYDRVMVYRFDETGAGEVVAEARADGIDSFLGLHFPASDIPQQARRLYTQNLLRIIADVDAVPAAIIRKSICMAKRWT